MNYSMKTKENFHRNSKGSERKKYLFILIACALLFFAKSFIGTLTSGVSTVFYEVRHYMVTSSATIPAYIRSRSELLDTIHTLEQKIASQQGVESTLTYVMEENTELRTLMGASTSPSRILAGVIARPPYTPYDTLILDKGSADGIIEHAPVYYGAGHVLGYVHAVFPHLSYVTLFSSPGVESTVYLFGSNLFTTAYGEGGGVVHLSIPQGITLTKGDVVVLPSLDAGVLGAVDEIQSIPTEPEQHAYVTLNVPLQSIRLVSVGTTPVGHVPFEEAEMHITEEEKRLFTIPVPEEERIRKSATTTPEIDVSASSTEVMNVSSTTRL